MEILARKEDLIFAVQSKTFEKKQVLICRVDTKVL